MTRTRRFSVAVGLSLALALMAGALGVTSATAEEVEPVPTSLACVGDPPRQTADPLSPPCIPSFEGDNGCDTYGVGVTCDEVRIAILMDGGINYISGSGAPSSDRNIAPSDRKLYDLWKTREENNVANGDSPTTDEHLTVEGFRVWQQYFNERFQTYGRSVHFFVYYADPNDNTPEKRRENAADIRARVNPFAVVSFASEGAEDDFLVAMARKGILNFGSFASQPGSFFEEFPKMLWSYLPSVDQFATEYAAYLCTKVVAKAPVLAAPDIQQRNALPPPLGGNDGMRKLGLIHTSDEAGWPGLVRLADRTEQQVEGCGGQIALERTFPACCLAQDNGENPSYALTQMLEFKAAGVTTILWPGGLNGNYGKAAASIGYFPEWIIAGDTQLDANYPVLLSQNSAAFDGRAIVITPQVVEPALTAQGCYAFYREINATTPDADLGYTCEFYRPLHFLYTAIQVSGPYLGPTNIDNGMHAIPQRTSGAPDTPACYFLPGDYTCVKDAQAEYWSAASLPPGSNTPGCWRSIEGGRRYQHALDPWPSGNVSAQITGDEPCNGYSSSTRFNPL